MLEWNTLKCEPCRENSAPASREEIEDFQSSHSAWKVVEVNGEPRVQREYSFPNFQSALEFANRVGALAEAENHHPLLEIEWGRVLVAWWTHSIKNLHRNDLILAARSDISFKDSAFKK